MSTEVIQLDGRRRSGGLSVARARELLAQGGWPVEEMDDAEIEEMVRVGRELARLAVRCALGRTA